MNPTSNPRQGNSRPGIRSLARQRALQLLYALHHATGDETFDLVEQRFLHADEANRRGWGPFARKLAMAAWMRRRDLDPTIAPCLHKWTIERLPVSDLIVLRMALAEFRYFEDIPLRVTINEYVDLAHMFCDDDAPAYINAILDRLARNFPNKDFQNQKTEPDQPDAPVVGELQALMDTLRVRPTSTETEIPQ